MHWTVRYQLLRAAVPTSDERQRIENVVARARAVAWDGTPVRMVARRVAARDGVILEGSHALPLDHHSSDPERVAAVVNRLLAALPGARLRVWDEFGIFGLDAEGRCVTAGRPSDAVAPTSGLFDPVIGGSAI